MRIQAHLDDVPGLDAASWKTMLEPVLDEALRPLLAEHGADHAVLHAAIGRLARGGFRVRLHVALPGKKIDTANGQGGDPRAAAQQAVRRLLRECKRHFDLLEARDLYKRRARRERLRALREQLAALPREHAERSQVEVAPLIERLSTVARRELAYLRAVGELPADYPTVADVVDEAIAETRLSWTAGTPPEALFRQALGRLFQVIDREVEANRLFARSVPLEAPVPPDARDQAEAMVEEEFHEYYQPDESVSLADVLPAETAAEAEGEPTTEELDAAGRRAALADLLKDLPRSWRRALQLAELEGLDSATVAAVLGAETATVEGWIAQARAFVAARCEEAGIEIEASRAALALLVPESPRAADPDRST